MPSSNSGSHSQAMTIWRQPRQILRQEWRHIGKRPVHVRVVEGCQLVEMARADDLTVMRRTRCIAAFLRPLLSRAICAVAAASRPPADLDTRSRAQGGL